MLNQILIAAGGSIIAVAIGALAWLAYHHPQHYDRVALPVSVITLCCLTFVIGWDVALETIRPTVIDFRAGWDAIDSWRISYFVWLALVGLLFYVQLCGLYVTDLKGDGRRRHDADDHDEGHE